MDAPIPFFIALKECPKKPLCVGGAVFNSGGSGPKPGVGVGGGPSGMPGPLPLPPGLPVGPPHPVPMFR